MEADGVLAQLQPGSSALARIGYDRQDFFDRYEEGCAVTDQTERGKVWEECLEMLMEDYAMMPVWHKSLGAAVKDNVEGFWWARDYEQIYYQFCSKKWLPNFRKRSIYQAEGEGSACRFPPSPFHSLDPAEEAIVVREGDSSTLSHNWGKDEISNRILFGLLCLDIPLNVSFICLLRSWLPLCFCLR